MASLAAGTRVGVYEIVELIGSGGMGEVYLARDSRLDREVALKIIAPQYAGDADRLSRFVREAKTSSGLNHPNVAHVYEIGEWDGLHYIVMEYVRGETLRQRIGSRGMPINEVIQLATQAADALDEAHLQGVVHRDLKPTNVMITSRGRVKILDFGLAKLIGDTPQADSLISTMPGDTMAGLVLGTLDYMSPEQIRGLPIDKRSDIFSFGVMLYEMITGRLPFASTSKTDTVYRITQVQPEAVTRYNYDVPPDLDRIVRKCLEKDPARRYQSVRELLIDLSRLREGSSDMLPLAAHAPRPRQSVWAITAAVLLAALLAGGGFIWLNSRPDVIESLAVVPDVGASSDQPTRELTEGVAASLASSLSQLANLNVAPRQRTTTRDATSEDPPAIADRLGVHGLLFVRLVQRGETATVYLELIDGAHDRMVWGKQFTLRLNEIELAQESISAEVAGTLGLLFNAEERRAQEVYQLYQRGRFHLGKRTESDIKRAVEFFQLAIDKDRGYARAWAGLAEAYNLLPTYSATKTEDVFPNARTTAEQAIKLDESLAEAHTQVGLVHFRWEWDWAAAERSLNRALELNRSYAEGHYWMALFDSALGRFDGAVGHAREAQSLDPLNPAIRAVSAWVLYLGRRYPEAITEARRAIDADRRNVVAYRYLGLAHAQAGNAQEAVDALQTAVSLSPASLHRAELAHTLAVVGRRTEASTILAELRAMSPRTYVSPYNLALVATALDDTRGALDYLDAAVRERANLLVWSKVDPRLDVVRSEPRFREVMRALQLPSP